MAVTTPEPVLAPPIAPRRRRLPTNLGTLIVLCVAAFLTLGPVVWTLSRAPTPREAGEPRHFSFSAFSDVFDQIDIVQLVLNSTLVTGLIVVGQMFAAGLAGYVFARIE